MLSTQHERSGIVRLAVMLCGSFLFVPLAFADAPALSVSGSLSFNYQIGGPPPAPGSLRVANATHGDMSWYAINEAPWASLGTYSGSMPDTTPGGSQTTSVIVNPAGLAPGTYTGSITVFATWSREAQLMIPVTNSPQTVAISLVVADRSPILSVSPATLSFSAVQGAPSIPTASISVTNAGVGTMQWSASVSASWLSLTQGPAGVTVRVNSQQLAEGFYSANIEINAPGAQPSSASVYVTLDVRARNPPSFVVDTTPLSFKGAAGAPSPPAQKLSVSNAGELALNWFATATTSNGGAWLKVSPAAGTNAGEVSISADTSSLSAGTYVGRVTMTAAGVGISPVIPVTLTLTKPASIQTTSTSLSFRTVIGTSNPANQVVAFQNGGDAPLTWSAASKTSNGNAWLKVSPASGTGNSQIVVSVDNSGMPAGTHAGQIVLTCTGGCAGITIPVTSIVLPPPSTIDAAGVVNAASLTPGAVSAGTVVTVYGARLGPDAGAIGKPDSEGLLPTSLGGTTVSIDGLPAPLFYVGATQINFQIPYEEAGKTKARVVIQSGVAQSSELDVTLVPASLGLFTTDGRQAAALNQDYSYNTPATPVPAGNVVMLFGTGQGPLDKRVATGAPGPANAPFPEPMFPISMAVNGKPANVLFAGTAPGLVGLLQLNLQIPEDTASGPATVTFRQGDAAVGQSVVVYVQAMAASPGTSPVH